MRKSFSAQALVSLTLVSLALLGAGCKKASPIVGKWTTQVGTGTIEYNFMPDGTAAMSAKQGSIQVDTTTTYKLEGDKLTQTIKNVEVKGGQPGQADFIKKFAESQMGKEQAVTVKFSGDDQMSIADLKGRALPLTRSK